MLHRQSWMAIGRGGVEGDPADPAPQAPGDAAARLVGGPRADEAAHARRRDCGCRGDPAVKVVRNFASRAEDESRDGAERQQPRKARPVGAVWCHAKLHIEPASLVLVLLGDLACVVVEALQHIADVAHVWTRNLCEKHVQMKCGRFEGRKFWPC